MEHRHDHDTRSRLFAFVNVDVVAPQPLLCDNGRLDRTLGARSENMQSLSGCVPV